MTTLSRSYARPVGLGAVLIQEQQGSKRVISYASKNLSEVEKRNSQTEKEAAVVWVYNGFYVYPYSIRNYILKQIKAMHKNLVMDPEATTLQVQS